RLSGWAIFCVSPVSMSLMWIPLRSAYARYFPSGETAALSTGFSLELTVSCLCFGCADGGGVCGQNQRMTEAASSNMRAAPPHRSPGRGGRVLALEVAFQALQIATYLRSMLVSKLTVFLQTLVYDSFKFGGDLWIQTRRQGGGHAQNGVKNHRRCIALEWRC